MTKKIDKINKLWFGIGGAVLVLAALLIKADVAPPYETLHHIGATELLPPMWFLGLLWLSFYFLIGGNLGDIFTQKCLQKEQEIKKYQGALLCFIGIASTFLWYRFLFEEQRILFSWIILWFSVFGCITAGICWLKVSLRCGVTMLLISICLLGLMILQLMVMLNI